MIMDEKKEPAEEVSESPTPQWEYRTSMKVTERLKTIVSATIDATKAERDRLRKKMEKLTYGS
jgi:hypothetical protein